MPSTRRDKQFEQFCKDRLGKDVGFVDEAAPDPQADEKSWIYGDIKFEVVTKPLKHADYVTLGLKSPRKKLTKAQRSRILERKKNMCAICGYQWYLEIHHIDGDPGNNDPSNLQLLCQTHHNDIHKKMKRDELV